MQHVNSITLYAVPTYTGLKWHISVTSLAVTSYILHATCQQHNTRCCLRFQALDCDIKFASLSCDFMHAACQQHTTRCCLGYSALDCDTQFASLSCDFLRAACQQHNTRCCLVYSSLDGEIKFANLSCGFLEHVTLQHVINTPQDAAWDIQLWTVISSLPALAAVCMSSTHD